VSAAATTASLKAHRRHEKGLRHGEKENITTFPMFITCKQATWEVKITDLRDGLTDGG